MVKRLHFSFAKPKFVSLRHPGYTFVGLLLSGSSGTTFEGEAIVDVFRGDVCVQIVTL